MRSLYLVQSGLVLSGLAAGYVINPVQVQAGNGTTPATPLLATRKESASDFGWVKKWAAVGDSFTAGIGAGTQLGSAFVDKDSWDCSRYDASYPMVMNKAFGPAVEKFQYVACSGDRSPQIYKQITDKLESDLDFVTLTAGGNDLCLAAMIKTCVFFPFSGESACDDVISKAESNVKTILKPNLKSLLVALKDKVKKDGVVVYNGYAQFFNTDDDDYCGKSESWAWKVPTQSGFAMSGSRNKRFNSLVISINDAIKEVIEDVKKNSDIKYRLRFSNWDPYVYKAVRGQFCDPKGDRKYPSVTQPDLHFFKYDTNPLATEHDELRRSVPVNAPELAAIEHGTAGEAETLRERDQYQAHMAAWYNSPLWKSPNPAADALHQLNPRDAPTTPECPGDNSWGAKLSEKLGSPDMWGKYFHPNELGHQTVAAFALGAAVKARAEILGETVSCEIVDDFKCFSADGSKSYAKMERMNENYIDFCENKVKQPEHETGWSKTEPYHKGTPDEMEFSIELTDQAADFNKQECLDAFNKIVNGCDGNKDENPMYWKFGGKWRKGEYTYTVTPKRQGRLWPPPKAPIGNCKGTYRFLFSTYYLNGAGSSGDDNGKSLQQAVKDCIGSWPSAWKFYYWDPLEDGKSEWHASFNTPIWVRQRCFNNHKVQKQAHGFESGGCQGSD